MMPCRHAQHGTHFNPEEAYQDVFPEDEGHDADAASCGENIEPAIAKEGKDLHRASFLCSARAIRQPEIITARAGARRSVYAHGRPSVGYKEGKAARRNAWPGGR